jgi:hypothetical protein
VTARKHLAAAHGKLANAAKAVEDVVVAEVENIDELCHGPLLVFKAPNKLRKRVVSGTMHLIWTHDRCRFGHLSLSDLGAVRDNLLKKIIRYLLRDLSFATLATLDVGDFYDLRRAIKLRYLLQAEIVELDSHHDETPSPIRDVIGAEVFNLFESQFFTDRNNGILIGRVLDMRYLDLNSDHDLTSHLLVDNGPCLGVHCDLVTGTISSPELFGNHTGIRHRVAVDQFLHDGVSVALRVYTRCRHFTPFAGSKISVSRLEALLHLGLIGKFFGRNLLLNSGEQRVLDLGRSELFPHLIQD